jgi:proline racemase
MIINQVISTIDLHVAGEPLRTLYYNPLFERRETMKEYQEDIDHFDFIPLLLKEPRGHSDMNLCVITPPISSEAKCGLLFKKNVNGNVPLMEHGLIGAATVLFEVDNFRGNEIIFDCLNGQVKVHIDNDTQHEQVKSISYFEQVRYNYQNLLLDTCTIDLIITFQTIGIINLKQLDMTLSINSLNEIKRINHQLFKIIDNYQLSDPINHLIFFSEGDRQPIFLCIDRFGHIDRSPYTGAGAVAAYLLKKGLCGVNQMNRVDNFLNHSIETRITTSNDKRDELLVEIKGKAFITGFHQFAVDTTDPLKEGFLLK